MIDFPDSKKVRIEVYIESSQWKKDDSIIFNLGGGYPVNTFHIYYFTEQL